MTNRSAGRTLWAKQVTAGWGYRDSTARGVPIGGERLSSGRTGTPVGKWRAREDRTHESAGLHLKLARTVCYYPTVESSKRLSYKYFRRSPIGGRLSRIKLRFMLECRKRLIPTLDKATSSRWIPGLKGILRYLIAKREVRRAIRLLAPPSPSQLPPDALTPQMVPSVAQKGDADRVLAELDQDGFLFAVDPVDEKLFNRREEKLPRTRYQLDVVLRNGVVCLRKHFRRQPITRRFGDWAWDRAGLPFYNEAAALIRLVNVDCVPRISEIDERSRTVYMVYIQGEDARHHLAWNGHSVHGLDIHRHPVLSRLSLRERKYREAQIFASQFTAIQKKAIKLLVCAMNRNGVAPQDVKLGNLVIGARQGTFYWVDFEGAHVRSFPGWSHQVQKQHYMFNSQFDLDFITRHDVEEFAKTEIVDSAFDFGYLGHMGNITDLENGVGYWRLLLSRQTSWKGKRVLELEGHICLHAIRGHQDGAEEVQCVESSPTACRQAIFARSVIEQMEGRSLNVKIHNKDTTSFLGEAVFESEYFDIVFVQYGDHLSTGRDLPGSLAIVSQISREVWIKLCRPTTGRNRSRRHEGGDFERLMEHLKVGGFDDVTPVTSGNHFGALIIGRKTKSL